MAGSNSTRIVTGVVLLGTVLALAGCDDYRARRDEIVAEHGNAVRHNIAVQTIDPWPPTSRNPHIDIDGERILVGAERYKANKSIEPKGLATQSVSTGSGQGGSGGNSR